MAGRAAIAPRAASYRTRAHGEAPSRFSPPGYYVWTLSTAVNAARARVLPMPGAVDGDRNAVADPVIACGADDLE
jgi:hypothetical protein